MSDEHTTPTEQDEVQATPTSPRPWYRRTGVWVAGIVAVAVVTFGLTALLVNILERQKEATVPYAQVVELNDTIDDPAVWGQNFPLHYQMYLQTEQMEGTTYGGSTAIEHQPTADDPRTVVTPSRIEHDPRLVTMWAGYPFSVDYREARGHFYMLLDQQYTLRNLEFKQPGACINCHASTVTAWTELGDGDLEAGWRLMNPMPYADAGKLVEHPIACIDCHDPKTMELRITRPAFIEGIAGLKEYQGIEGYDVNKDATYSEMRTFVCAQCHVEYYFDGEEKTLTFPWTHGIEASQMYAYYQEDGHIDFEHKIAGTQIIKAQHPEFEMYSQGIHAQAGVSCADCHMPYVSEGAHKVTQHHIASPLLSVSASCGTCHNEDPQVMTDRVLTIQNRFVEARDRAMAALVILIDHIADAQTNGTDAAQVALAQRYHQEAQFYIDLVYSENSSGFHADQYMMGLLEKAQDLIRKAELALTGMTQAELDAIIDTTAQAQAPSQDTSTG